MKRSTPLTRTAWLRRGLTTLKRFVGVKPRRATPRRKAHPANEPYRAWIRLDLADLLYQMTDHGLDPSRPYDGQPHTDAGERGKTLVAGLTFRDVCDCFVIGWLMASGRSSLAESGTASYNDVFEPGVNPTTGEPDTDIDPLAVMQNMACEMERRMGIYPNVPPLTWHDAPAARE